MFLSVFDYIVTDCTCLPSKYAGSGLDPASYGHFGQWAAGIGPDPICRIRFPTSDSDPDRMLFSAPEVAGIIIIGSVFVHLDPFRYRCVELNEARSDLPPAKQTRTTSGMSILGRVFIDRSESDPFLYIRPGSDIDGLSSEI